MVKILTKVPVKLYSMMLISTFVLASCMEGKKNSKDQEIPGSVANDTLEEPEEKGVAQIQEYTSAKWGLAFEYPGNYKVYEGQLPGKANVVNVYQKEARQSPPFGIHEDASLAYISILPGGYGVDAPAGDQMTFLDWPKSLPLSFMINNQESIVYLLENGEPWAYSLRFHSSPGSWNEYGLIFLQLKINNFRSICSGKDGEVMPMEACDPLTGNEIKHFGEPDPKSREELKTILSSVYFFEENPFREPIEEFIVVQQPQENERISSPLKITGRAKGYWFFEGTAPFKIVDEEYRILARGFIKAQGDWMTKDLVPFEAEVEFSPEEGDRGFIILNRSNPSGKPANDRVYKLPIKFN